MPFHPVTAALMYRGIYTVPNLLSEQRPVDIPEDELEGECPAGTPATRPPTCAPKCRAGSGRRGPCRATRLSGYAGGGTAGWPRAPRWGSPRRRGSPVPARVAPGAAETCGAPQWGYWAAWPAVTVRQGGGG